MYLGFGEQSLFGRHDGILGLSSKSRKTPTPRTITVDQSTLRISFVKKLSINGIIVLPAWKRAIDLVCCLLGLPFLFLTTGVMFVTTKLLSPGSIIFRQERVGYKGNRFYCLKFRTMQVGADTTIHKAHLENMRGTNSPMAKLDSIGDQRLIPGGWFLRAAGLDELPQIINVFRGEMSIVGPRPCLPHEYDGYRSSQLERFDAAPGLTGLWQVSGKNKTTFDEMVALDIKYARKRSFWTDVQIIALTVPTLVHQIIETYRARHSRPNVEQLPGVLRPSKELSRHKSRTAIF